MCVFHVSIGCMWVRTRGKPGCQNMDYIIKKILFAYFNYGMNINSEEKPIRQCFTMLKQCLIGSK